MTVQMHLGVVLSEDGRMECELEKRIAALSAADTLKIELDDGDVFKEMKAIYIGIHICTL